MNKKNTHIYIYITYMYDINNIVSSMFEIEMVLAFSKLSLRKKSSPEERKSPAAALAQLREKKRSNAA